MCSYLEHTILTMCLFSKYLISVCCVPVTVLGKRDDSAEHKVTTVVKISSSWMSGSQVAVKQERKEMNQVWGRWWFWLGTSRAWEAVGHPGAHVVWAAGSVAERKPAVGVVGSKVGFEATGAEEASMGMGAVCEQKRLGRPESWCHASTKYVLWIHSFDQQLSSFLSNYVKSILYLVIVTLWSKYNFLITLGELFSITKVWEVEVFVRSPFFLKLCK